jgi:hypothetical protein
MSGAAGVLSCVELADFVANTRTDVPHALTGQHRCNLKGAPLPRKRSKLRVTCLADSGDDLQSWDLKVSVITCGDALVRTVKIVNGS